MKKIKLGIVRGWGISSWELKQYEKMKDFGIEPILICNKDNRADLSKVNIEKRKLFRWGQINKIPLLSQIIQYFFLPNSRLIGLKKAIKDIDILETTELFTPFSVQCVKSGKPTIVKVWENIPLSWESNPYFGLKRFGHIKNKKIVKKGAAHFTAVTRKAKEVLEFEGISPSKISVIHAGIDTDEFKPSKKEKSDKKIILCVCRLVWEKGVHDLIFAVKQLVQKYKNIELIIAGNGPYKKTLINLVKELKIEKNVKFIGEVSYENMPKLMNSADIFCLPSRITKYWQEQFGYVLVEAMACNKPVVSTLSGSIPEVVENNKTGILVEPGDRDGLANALNHLISTPELMKRLGETGRKRVIEKFNINKIAKEYAELCKELIK